MDRHDLDSTATSWLATFFVIVGGIGICSFLTLAFSDDPVKPLLIVGGSFLAIGTLVWLLRERPKNHVLEHKYFWLVGGPKIKSHRYKLRLARNPSLKPYGTNQPPSAEEIRQLRDNANQWTPRCVKHVRQ